MRDAAPGGSVFLSESEIRATGSRREPRMRVRKAGWKIGCCISALGPSESSPRSSRCVRSLDFQDRRPGSICTSRPSRGRRAPPVGGGARARGGRCVSDRRPGCTSRRRHQGLRAGSLVSWGTVTTSALWDCNAQAIDAQSMPRSAARRAPPSAWSPIVTLRAGSPLPTWCRSTVRTAVTGLDAH